MWGDIAVNLLCGWDTPCDTEATDYVPMLYIMLRFETRAAASSVVIGMEIEYVIELAKYNL